MRQRTYEASEAAKREICAALKTLMAQKPLNKITIAEIMQSCGMARQHFYYHFEDIYDAVHWMFDQEAVALLREHEGVMLWQDGLLQLFQYLQENRVRMVPTWEITGTRPSAALSTCSSTCLRSSRVSSSPSPEDPQQ